LFPQDALQESALRLGKLSLLQKPNKQLLARSAEHALDEIEVQLRAAAR